MDRNFYFSDKDADWVRSLSARRAWIEICFSVFDFLDLSSLSARRAWIEILVLLTPRSTTEVALRKESVDRNIYVSHELPFDRRSLSARRAWIEIILLTMCFFCSMSLSARRAWIEISFPLIILYAFVGSLSARRAWIEIFYVLILSYEKASRSPQGERG